MPKDNSEVEFVRCLDCKFATFMQWFTNPVVAFCSEMGERQVAATQRKCKLFQPSGIKNPPIEHFDHYEPGQGPATRR